MPSINLLIAETQYLIIEGLKSIFRRFPDFHIAGEIVNKEELFSYLHQHSPDILLIDPLHLDGFRIDDIRTINTVSPGTRILILTEINNADAVHKIVETGVMGYLTKTCDESEIMQTIYALMQGEKMYCHKVVNIILQGYEQTVENCAPTVLSEREIEVIRLIANGYTTRQIADTLFRSFHTITTHRRNIMKKLAVNSSSELLVYAMNTGLIQSREQLVATR